MLASSFPPQMRMWGGQGLRAGAHVFTAWLLMSFRIGVWHLQTADCRPQIADCKLKDTKNLPNKGDTIKNITSCESEKVDWEHYWIKTCENAVKNLWIKLWKNTWTVQFYMFSHMFFTPFSQGVKLLRPCEKGSFHRVRTHAKPCEKPCEFLPCEKTCERPCEKPVKNLLTFTVFFSNKVDIFAQSYIIGLISKMLLAILHRHDSLLTQPAHHWLCWFFILLWLLWIDNDK